MREGALAEKLALARDNGMTMPEAIDAVLSENPDATREWVVAQAALLFQHFRRLPVQQAACEFQLACVDDTPSERPVASHRLPLLWWSKHWLLV